MTSFCDEFISPTIYCNVFKGIVYGFDRNMEPSLAQECSLLSAFSFFDPCDRYVMGYFKHWNLKVKDDSFDNQVHFKSPYGAYMANLAHKYENIHLI